MKLSPFFNILDMVDSTNNYAMAMVHEGMARHGEAWFAREQIAGKGQRGKQWYSERDSSIILSITLQPSPVFISNPFYLSAVVAVTCKKFVEQHTQNTFFIKWPNDLYWGDRKTGGILIENQYIGSTWAWAVLGIGINVKRSVFNVNNLPNAASLAEIAGNNTFDIENLARELHANLLQKLDITTDGAMDAVLGYNEALFKRNETVRLRKGNIVFGTRVKEVNPFGQLITEDNMQRVFNHGEVEWLPGI